MSKVRTLILCLLCFVGLVICDRFTVSGATSEKRTTLEGYPHTNNMYFYRIDKDDDKCNGFCADIQFNNIFVKYVEPTYNEDKLYWFPDSVGYVRLKLGDIYRLYVEVQNDKLDTSEMNVVEINDKKYNYDIFETETFNTYSLYIPLTDGYYLRYAVYMDNFNDLDEVLKSLVDFTYTLTFYDDYDLPDLSFREVTNNE